MARTKISEYSATAADNTDINSINIAEGCAPSGINNAIREMMKQLKDFQAGTSGDPFTTSNISYTGTLTGGTGVINIGSGQVYKDASGNVGIGTSSPQGKFDVVGSVVNTLATFSTADASTVVLNNLNGAAFGRNSKILFRNNGLNLSGIASVYTNFNGAADIGGALAFGTQTNAAGGIVERLRIDSSGNVGIGTSSPDFPSGGGLVVYNNGLPRIELRNSTTGSASTDGAGMVVSGQDFVLYNRESTGIIAFNTSATERLRIDSSGNVGIGTSSPISKLTIAAAGEAGTRYLGNGLTSAGFFVGYNGAAYVYNDSNTAMIFGTNATERLRIDSSGNVGIGTSSPNSKLQVNGRIFANGSLTSNSGDTDFNAGGSRAFLDWSGSLARIGTLTGGGAGGDCTFFVNNAERARIDSSGNLLVGTTSAAQTTNGIKLLSTGRVLGTSGSDSVFYRTADDAILQFRNNNGGTNTLKSYIGNTGTLVISSDQRFKKDIVDIDPALEKIIQLRPVKFHWLSQAEADPKTMGFIAQEVEQIIPEMVTEKEDFKALDTHSLFPLLVKAIQELKAEVDSLKSQLNSGA
jgi:hypothetical protein